MCESVLNDDDERKHTALLNSQC